MTFQRWECVFEDRLLKQQWKEDQEGKQNLEWVLRLLCTTDRSDLAIEVAVSQLEQGKGAYLVYLFSAYPLATSPIRERVLVALEMLKKLNNSEGFEEVVKVICTQSKVEIGILFHQARTWGDYTLAVHLYKHCLKKEDLLASFPWFLDSPNLVHTLTDLNICMTDK